MQNNLPKTHIETLYVCFLPTQVSQIRPLIEVHQEVIEAQYPIKDKLEPYCIHDSTTTFLFIPIKNMRTLNIQDVIDLAIEIEQLNLSHHIKTYDIHLALLQKYLQPAHVAIIETAIINKFDENQNQHLDTAKLKPLPQSVVERTLCLVQGEDVAMYEYIPENTDKLMIIIRHVSEINPSIINALLDLNIGIVLIVYQNKFQNSQEWIAMNGLTVKTHSNNYYNILFDALNYAKQYRMKVMVLNWVDKGTGKKIIHLKHNQTKVIEALVAEQFDVEYSFQNSIHLEDNLDINTVQNRLITSVISSALIVTMYNYPENHAVFDYVIQRMIKY